MSTYTVVIPNWKPTSVNKLLGSHWAAARKKKSADMNMVGMYVVSAGIPKATGKRRLSFEVSIKGRGRRPDPDNFLKVLCDGLVKCGMLVDDSSKWVEYGKMNVVSGDKLETIITLEDVTD